MVLWTHVGRDTAAGHSKTEHSVTARENDDDFGETKCGHFAHFCLFDTSHTPPAFCVDDSYREVLGLIEVMLYKKIKAKWQEYCWQEIGVGVIVV